MLKLYSDLNYKSLGEKKSIAYRKAFTVGQPKHCFYNATRPLAFIRSSCDMTCIPSVVGLGN